MTMEITPQEITIRDLFDGYKDNGEKGVYGYGGKLNIRPPYQREFVYKEEEQIAVIRTVKKDYPLNVMYWADNGNNRYEVIDGQQRILSICKYLDNKFSLPPEHKKFKTLLAPQRKQIEDYNLLVYFCKGNIEEKLDWFRTINIRGLKLEPQELRNAVYAERGKWLADAKLHFSKTNGPADRISKNYLNCRANRQEILERAIEWIAGNGDVNIRKYMTDHQHDSSADELWLHFKAIIDWVDVVFTKKHKKYMKSVDWGSLYADHGKKKLDFVQIKKEIDLLMADREVTKKPGIYAYVLDGEEKHLNLRVFDIEDKQTVLAQQEYKCAFHKKPNCPKKDELLDIDDAHADHKIPWSKGGKTELKNLQVLCRDCNIGKGAR